MARPRLLVLLLVLLLGVACHAMESRFTKNVKVDDLEKQWKEDDDEETEDWHEDSFEWREKNMQRGGINLMGGGQKGKMVISFVELKKKLTKRKGDLLARQWNSLLKTGGVQAHALYIEQDNQIIFTQEDGMLRPLREFALRQPEVESFFADGKSSTPDDLPKEN